MAGNKPAFRGAVQLDDSKNIQIGKAVFWENKEPKSDKSPKLTGFIEIGESIEKKDGNLIIKGKVKKYKIALWS